MGKEISNKINNSTGRKTTKKAEETYISPVLQKIIYWISEESIKNGDSTREGSSIFINYFR